jgi:hypothetical protein
MHCRSNRTASARSRLPEPLPMPVLDGCNRRASRFRSNGAAQESNLPSVGLPRLTGFEDERGAAQLSGSRQLRAILRATWLGQVLRGRVRAREVVPALIRRRCLRLPAGRQPGIGLVLPGRVSPQFLQRLALWSRTARETPLRGTSPISSNSMPATLALCFASSLTTTSRGRA